eukprot:10844371-Alexandrium_andersonii.AAC.1
MDATFVSVDEDTGGGVRAFWNADSASGPAAGPSQAAPAVDAPASRPYIPLPRTRLQERVAGTQPGAEATAGGQRPFGGPWACDRPAAAMPPAAGDGASDTAPGGMYGPSTEGPEDVADMGPLPPRA